MDVTVRAAGKEQEPILKRLSESRAFTVDCSALMGVHEIFVKILEVTASGVDVVGLRASGSALTLSISGGTIPPAQPHVQPSRDFPVTVQAQTNLGTLVVPLVVRVIT